MDAQKREGLKLLIRNTLDRSCDPSRIFDGLITLTGSHDRFGDDASAGLVALFEALERESQAVFREVQEALETVEMALREEGGGS